jgi:hypothetical protein
MRGDTMKLLVILTLIICMGLVSCISVPPMPSGEDVKTAIAKTKQANLLIPSVHPENKTTPTSLPEPTDLPLPTSTISLIATVIAQPKPIFEHARIYGIAHLQTGHLLISIEISGDLHGNYQAVVGNEVFDCSILPQYANRLYCVGQDVYAGELVQLSIIEIQSKITVFQDEIGIPPSQYTAQLIHVDKNKPENNGTIKSTPVPTSPPPAYPYP